MTYYYAYVDENNVLCVDQLDWGYGTPRDVPWEEREVAALAESYPDTIYFTVDKETDVVQGGHAKPKVSIPTSVPLLDAAEFDRLWYEVDEAEWPLLSVVRTVAARYASTGRAIYQPLADLVAGKEVCAEHLHDVALWACSLDGGVIYRNWLVEVANA